MDETMAVDSASVAPVEEVGFHKALKTKFIEGNAGFMSLVALALVLGLAFCIERIIYLSLSEINAKKFMKDLDAKIMRSGRRWSRCRCRLGCSRRTLSLSRLHAHRQRRKNKHKGNGEICNFLFHLYID